ncbi:MAG: bifunctional 4-hydroxy-2-oxoglutarate aldolase/2-dehydro-3-deoxy-phosphogluconate aldolase [Bacillus subtilis]|nr:bifunctional 4-hydroxy-2-oxoglutarate aldolase/2-dehydro-3-deoxy-phosphogluconate aldolase [Bacillus subtilis]
MLVGAGTVLSVDQVKQSVKAGARSIVSPGLNPRVAEYCVKEGIPVTPGINNPSGIEAALDLGIRVLKFFLAEPSGGLGMLKAMAAPYGDVSFIPTGGIGLENMPSYLSWNRIVAVGGSWIAPNDLIAAGKVDEIQQLTSEAVARIHGFELMHIGVNESDEAAAATTAALLQSLFFLQSKHGNSSIFAGKAFEIMKGPYLGTHGHVGLSVNSVERALAFLKGKGIGTRPETAKSEGGSLKVIYLDREIAGFAIHLSRR